MIQTSFINSYCTNSYWENKDGNMRPAGKKKKKKREKEDIIRIVGIASLFFSIGKFRESAVW